MALQGPESRSSHFMLCFCSQPDISLLSFGEYTQLALSQTIKDGYGEKQRGRGEGGSSLMRDSGKKELETPCFPCEDLGVRAVPGDVNSNVNRVLGVLTVRTQN